MFGSLLCRKNVLESSHGILGVWTKQYQNLGPENHPTFHFFSDNTSVLHYAMCCFPKMQGMLELLLWPVSLDMFISGPTGDLLGGMFWPDFFLRVSGQTFGSTIVFFYNRSTIVDYSIVNSKRKQPNKLLSVFTRMSTWAETRVGGD